MKAQISNLHWQSDWNGEDVGYPHIDIVGLYTSHELGVDLYVNTDNGEVLEVFMDEEEY